MTISARSPPAGGGVGGRADGGGPGGGTRRPGRGHRGRGRVQPQGRGVAAGLLLGVLQAQARAEPLDEVFHSVCDHDDPHCTWPALAGLVAVSPLAMSLRVSRAESRTSVTPRLLDTAARLEGHVVWVLGNLATRVVTLLPCCSSRGYLSNMFTFM